MKIAHCVEFYHPSVGGMQEVVKQLSERIADSGHDVTVFTSYLQERDSTWLNGVTLREFRIKGNGAVGLVGDIEEYLRELREGQFDLIVLFAAQQWTTDSVLPHLADMNSKVVFVPTGFSALYNTDWAQYFEDMRNWMKSVDLNIVSSEKYRDVAFARKHGVDKVRLIPNGAAREEFDVETDWSLREAVGLEPNRLVVLHVGSYTGSKGHAEAIRIFARASASDSSLVFVGTDVLQFRRSFQSGHSLWKARRAVRKGKLKIFFLELDRARTVAALKQADVFLFPSLIECSPIVLFEAMASRTAFLASRAGNSAEIAEWSNGGLIISGRQTGERYEVPSVRDGARLLRLLIEDPIRRNQLADSGYRAWGERFTWDRIAGMYMSEYEALLR
jgi:L-malate glycosyltransferase